MLIKFAGDIKFGRIANTLEDRNQIKEDLDRLYRILELL